MKKALLLTLTLFLASATTAFAQTDSHTLNLAVAEWAYVEFDQASANLSINPFELTSFGGGELSSNAATVTFRGGTNSDDDVLFVLSSDKTTTWEIDRTVAIAGATQDAEGEISVEESGTLSTGNGDAIVTAKQAMWTSGSITYSFSDPDPLMAPGSDELSITLTAQGF